MGQVIERGQVRWYKFPHPNKRRPVLVLMRTDAIEYLNEVVVAQITSQTRDVPSQVDLDRSDGVKRRCGVNLYQINTVPKSKLGPLITTLSSERMQEVDVAMRFALGLIR